MGLGKSKLIFYLDFLTSICRLCILSSIASELLTNVCSEVHSDFACYYEIISWSWFIQRWNRLLCFFIQYCLQYLTFYTQRHLAYSLLQLIQSLLVSFFTLILDFILTLSLSKEGYKALISVTWKFSRRVTLIKGKDIFIVEEWAYVFLARHDLINGDLFVKLIIKWDPKVS